MWLVSDFTPADLDDPQPGIVIAGRIEAEHLDKMKCVPLSGNRRCWPRWACRVPIAASLCRGLLSGLAFAAE